MGRLPLGETALQADTAPHPALLRETSAGGALCAAPFSSGPRAPALSAWTALPALGPHQELLNPRTRGKGYRGILRSRVRRALAQRALKS